MKILCFGIAKEVMGTAHIEIDGTAVTTIQELRSYLSITYPELNKYSQYMVAVNQTYAENTEKITGADEIAIIPPVSGG